jgi:MFS family permease
MVDQSIVLIALPDIFRGVHADPLDPANTGLLLWMILGPIVVAAVLVVTFGRIGDMYGRVRIYNLGFAVFTVFSALLTVSWMYGSAGALWLVIMRLGQGVGGAMLLGNSAAILTDAFPKDERGLALGINGTVGMAGTFIGLVLGGLLAPVSWRMVFFVSVPVGLFGTVWAYLMLHEPPKRAPRALDWWGNVTFALSLLAILVGATYGIQPYGGRPMGWTNPLVVACLAVGVGLMGLFVFVERRVRDPMFRLELFRIRAFMAGNIATGASAMARGGLQFTLIIWLQGIWLPLHGYDYASTPLWAAIFMMPLVAGFLIAGPVSGWLSDRYGARLFATGGMLVAAACFVSFALLPVDFSYEAFALIVFLDGVGMGLFSSPNRAAVMNSLPREARGVGGGMNMTFLNTASVLSIGIFFSLMIVGLSSQLSTGLVHGLVKHGVSPADAASASHISPVSSIFAAFLGYNPIRQLLGPRVLHSLPASRRHQLTSHTFFPHLISQAFDRALVFAFVFAVACCVVAAVASWMRGGIYHSEDEPQTAPEAALSWES